MKNNKFLGIIAIICVLSLFNVEAKNVVTLNWNDFPYHTSQSEVDLGIIPRNYPLDICPPDMLEIRIYGCKKLPVGGTLDLEQDFSFRIYKQSIDDFVPVQPKRHVIITFRKLLAIKQEPMLGMAALAQSSQQRRRLMLNYPPAGTVWHTPAGVTQLTSLVRKNEHDVRQRWGHIIGLEYMLKRYSGNQTDWALSTIRSPDQNVLAYYAARTILERVSESIPTQDHFRFERNNVVYRSVHQDGTIRGALNAIADRKNHLWYPYFNEVEVPAARDFNPHVYDVSIGDERQLFPGLILASMVKKALPDCVVIVGGNFFGRIPDPADYPDFAELFDHLDGMVYAEGFQPLTEIVNTLDVSTATGTMWRDVNSVIKNPRTTSPTDFDSLPAQSLDGGAKQWSPETVASLYTSSHCALACDFCAIAALSDTFASGRLDNGQKIKPRSICPRQIALNMQSLGTSSELSDGVNKFDITDELFSIGHQLELGRELRRIGFEATWSCYLTVTDNLLNPQVARDLYVAGCRSVQFGLETLSKETLFKLHKQWNTPTSYDRILQNFRDAGIHTHVFLMVGLPTEPLHEGLRSVGFIQKYGHNILTIKSGRWRPARYAPEVEKGLLEAHVRLLPDTRPFQTNRSFEYRNNVSHANTKVDAMRDIHEQACRRHSTYNVTSTIPWWVNRSRYTWEQLENMARVLPPEPDIPHLKDRIAQMRTIVDRELGLKPGFQTWDELAQFSETLL